MLSRYKLCVFVCMCMLVCSCMMLWEIHIADTEICTPSPSHHTPTRHTCCHYYLILTYMSHHNFRRVQFKITRPVSIKRTNAPIYSHSHTLLSHTNYVTDAPIYSHSHTLSSHTNYVTSTVCLPQGCHHCILIISHSHRHTHSRSHPRHHTTRRFLLAFLTPSSAVGHPTCSSSPAAAPHAASMLSTFHCSCPQAPTAMPAPVPTASECLFMERCVCACVCTSFSMK